MEEKKSTVQAEVSINMEQAVQRVSELVGLIKTANSLADELAETLKNLEFDIKV